MPTRMIKSFKRGADKKSMTNQQQMFVKYLLADPSFNLTKAAKQSGYKNPRTMGSKLIKHPAVSHAIGKEIRLRSEKLEFTAEEVLLRIKTILEVDITDIYDEEGYTSMTQIKKLPTIVRQCINRIKTHRKYHMNDDGEKESYTVVELDWVSKDNALNMAMRHFGLMEPELSINIVSDELKSQVLVDLLGQLNDDQGVIDATAITKLASE